MGTAKSPEDYEFAWESHILELTCVLLEAKIPAEEWDAILLPIRNALSQAVMKLKEEETWKTPSS